MNLLLPRLTQSVSPKYFIVLVLFLWSYPIWAKAVYTYDNKGMPQCVYERNGGNFVQFQWSQDPYNRTVVANYYSLSGFNYDYTNTAPRAVDNSGSRYGNDDDSVINFKELCNPNERYYATSPESVVKGFIKRRGPNANSCLINDTNCVTHLIKPGTRSAFGIPITRKMRAAFKQVRKGANKYRDPRVTPWKYLTRNRIRNYTVNLNWKLSQDYGIGFASKVYTLWLENFGRNRKYKNDVLAEIKREAGQGSNLTRFRRKTSKYTIVFVRGFGHSRKLGEPRDAYKEITGDLRHYGFDLRILRTESWGNIGRNARSIQRDLERILIGEKRDVIIVAACRGVTESLMALSSLRQLLEGHSYNPSNGTVKGLVSLSGMIRGSFLIDWMFGFPQSFQTFDKVHEQGQAQGSSLTYWDIKSGFEQITTSSVAGYLNQRVIRNLPKKPFYMNVVGVRLGNGLFPKISELVFIQNQIRSFQSLYVSTPANDGYIEYPGSAIPHHWVPKVYDLAFDASHQLRDGKFKSYSMVKTSQRRYVLRGIFIDLIKRIEGSRK